MSQDESMYYEHKKHDGSLPLVAVDTFLPREHAGDIVTGIELIRSIEAEKEQQIESVRRWQQSRNTPAPKGETSYVRLTDANEEASTVHDGHSLAYLQNLTRNRQNVFAALMEAVKIHSRGQISHALYDVDGECRRNM